MAVVERDFYAEAEERLGRSLTQGERFIDLAANDATMEAAKQALYEAIEKEKRRSIRKFLAGQPHDLRVTPEMTDIIVRLRLAGMDAAEAEVGRATRPTVRAMAGQIFDPWNRWEIRMVFDTAGKQTGYRIYDKQLGDFIQSFGVGEFQRAQGFIDGLINKAEAAAAKTAQGSAFQRFGVGQNAKGEWVILDELKQPWQRFGSETEARNALRVLQAASVPAPATTSGLAGPWSVHWDQIESKWFAIPKSQPGLAQPFASQTAAVDWARNANEVAGFGRSLPIAIHGAPATTIGLASGGTLTREIEQRFPGWIWDDTTKMFVPKDLQIRDAYKALYGPPRVSDNFDPNVMSRMLRLRDQEGVPNGVLQAAINAHDRGIARAGPLDAPMSWVQRPGADWEIKFMRDPVHGIHAAEPSGYIVDWDPQLGKFVARDSMGRPALITPSPGGTHGGTAGFPGGPRVWDERSRAERWVAKENAALGAGPSPADVRSTLETPPGQPRLAPAHGIRGVPGGSRVDIPSVGSAPWIPPESDIAAERARLIAEGVLRATVPMNPAQMLLFDPQLQPLMDAFHMQLRGITKRITKEGNAQLEINQDAAVSALARAIDKKVPGALDAAGRMVSGPFNAGLGDVFKRKGGLFTKWQYSAVMDKATCEVCAYFDGTIYYSWRSIAELPSSPLPNGGPNPGCFGDQRCRCRPVPYFGTGRVGDIGEQPTAPAVGVTADSTTGEESPLKGPYTSLEANDESGSSASFVGIDSAGKKVQIKPYEGLYPAWEDEKERIHEAIREGGDIEHERAAYQLSTWFKGQKGVTLRVPRAAVEFATITDDDYGIYDQVMRCVVNEWVEDSRHGYLGEGTDDEVRGIALFDAIIGNHDRHGRNYLDKNGLWAIDNGLAFPEFNNAKRPWNYDSLSEYRSRFGDDLDDDSMAFLDYLVKNKDGIDRDLQSWLEPEEIDSMWERVETMRGTGMIVWPNGDLVG